MLCNEVLDVAVEVSARKVRQGPRSKLLISMNLAQEDSRALEASY
jgi:hypothetical protein